MITHIVLLRWKPEMPAEHLASVASALDGLPPAISSIRSYRHGADLAVSAPTNADYATVATFDDVDGWRQYDTHPLHDRVRAEVLKPWIAERTAVQFET